MYFCGIQQQLDINSACDSAGANSQLASRNRVREFLDAFSRQAAQKWG